MLNIDRRLDIDRKTIHAFAAAADVCVPSVIKEIRQPGSVTRSAGERIRAVLRSHPLMGNR